MAVGILTLLWILVIVLVNPVGNFPLNDDWAYGRAVQAVLTKGRFELTDWAPASQIAQVLWGSLFCLPFGFSFTALRYSTLVLGWVGILATYALLGRLGAGTVWAFLGALLLLCNPVYLNSAFTFMTDVPFHAFCVLAIYFFVGGLQSESRGAIVFGTVFACAATLTRQFGIVLPVAFAVAYWLKQGWRWKTLLIGALPPLITMGCLLVYQFWLAAIGQLPQTYSEQSGELIRMFFSPEGMQRALRSLAQAALYVGLFLFPWLVLPVRHSGLPGRDRALGIGTGAVFAVAMLLVVGSGKPLREALIPYIFQGLIFDLGTGFPILKDILGLWLPHWPKGPLAFWIFVTTLGALGAALIGYFLTLAALDTYRAWRTDTLPSRWPVALALTGSLAYFLLIATRTASYDRYFFLFLPLTMILALRAARVGVESTGPAAAVCLVLTLGYGWFAVATTHDYLAWNRVRWDALDTAMAEGRLNPRNTDGGFEFNGWYLYDPGYRAQPGKSWWWVDRDDYAIAFGPIEGYEVYECHPFDRWMPIGPQAVLILKKPQRQHR